MRCRGVHRDRRSARDAAAPSDRMQDLPITQYALMYIMLTNIVAASTMKQQFALARMLMRVVRIRHVRMHMPRWLMTMRMAVR